MLFTTVVFAAGYKVGDSIYVLRDINGDGVENPRGRCSAVIVTAGSDQSKVEYTEPCQYNKYRFINDGDKYPVGYQEWVPNNSIRKKN